MYYIKCKRAGKYQWLCWDEGWYDADNETTWGGYWYLLGEDKKYASEFDSYDQAVTAIQDADEDLDDYDIVLEESVC